MSAISLGYPDWQRVANWDGPVVYNLPQATYSALQTSALFDVSRYAAIEGSVFLSAGTAKLTLQWFADQAQTILLGQRFIYYTGLFQGSSGFTQYLRVPNLGPYLKVTIGPDGGASFFGGVILAPTNRLPSPAALSLEGVAVQTTNRSIVNNTNAVTIPAYMAAGAATVSWNTVGQAGILRLFYQTGNAQYLAFVLDALGAIAYHTFPISLPLGFWYMQLDNTGSATSAYTAAVTVQP